MAKRIKRAQDLPGWFKLENYADTTELDAAGWYEQLSIRRDCFLMIESFDQNSFQPDRPIELTEDLLAVLEIIRKTPIVDLNSNHLLKIYFLGGPLHDFKDKSSAPHYSLGVHSMTVRQLRRIESCMSPGRREYSRRWQDQLQNNDWLNATYQYRHKNWLDDALYNSNMLSYDDVRVTESEKRTTASNTLPKRFRGKHEPVMVDLSLPDSILLKSFKQWLEAARNETRGSGTTKRYRNPAFTSWVRLGILPWLDLTLWSIEVNITIPNRVIADAIFPAGEGGEETVRKTTKPLALSLIKDQGSDDDPLSSLAAEAAHERFQAG